MTYTTHRDTEETLQALVRLRQNPQMQTTHLPRRQNCSIYTTQLATYTTHRDTEETLQALDRLDLDTDRPTDEDIMKKFGLEERRDGNLLLRTGGAVRGRPAQLLGTHQAQDLGALRRTVLVDLRQGKLDTGQSPTFSPPGYASSRLRPANQLHFLPYANAIYRMSPELNCVDTADKNCKN